MKGTDGPCSDTLLSKSRGRASRHFIPYLVLYDSPLSRRHVNTPKILGLLAVAFVTTSFMASPELRAFAAATVGSTDIIYNSIQSVDIKDAEVKMPDLASSAVTAAKIKDDEIKGAEIAGNAVTVGKIKDDTILPADVANPQFMKELRCCRAHRGEVLTMGHRPSWYAISMPAAISRLSL